MKIHFIGIGGIGVSALARYYLANGHKVSGSDLTSSEITDALTKIGVKVFIGNHKAKNLPKEIDLIIYSPAVPKTNPELKEAFKIRVLSYPQALGELTKKYFTIAVCGSHGKSTVAAMLGLILTRARVDPTVIIGTKLKEFGDSNFRFGKSKFLVIEADEHFASFLNYWPKVIVLTSLEKDHLDYFNNFKNYLLAFKKFILHLPKEGILIANDDDKNIKRITNQKLPIKNKNKIYYSLKQKGVEIVRKILKIPGEFNIVNALAALAAARSLKISDKISFKALEEYKGSWRRFEERDFNPAFSGTKLKIINDYAHHPTQVEATLRAARDRFPGKKIWCVYQPHQYQRTYYLFNDFVNAFAKAPVDKLIITDIYDVAGRENKEIKKKVSSKKLVKRIMNYESRIKNNIIYIPTTGEVVNYLKKNLQGAEVVIIMGAGDIYLLSKRLKI